MKLPWERDPHDLEASYRKPVPRADGIRLGIKAAAVVGAGVGFRFWILDRTHEGAKLVIALGGALLVAGLTDLVYLRRHELDLIFLRGKRQQRMLQTALAGVGAALLLLGALAYAP